MRAILAAAFGGLLMMAAPALAKEPPPLDAYGDLPGVEELAAAGLLEKNALGVPEDADAEAPADDESDEDGLDRTYLGGEAEAEAED